MTVDECVNHWKETGDTVFEAYIGLDLVEMRVDNHSGDVYISINDTDMPIEPEDIDTWNRY